MSEKEMRGLDAWIAEHVMEWTRVEKIGMLDHSCRYHYRKDTGEVFIHKRGNEVCYFHPTADRAAAMAVLEKCVTNNGDIVSIKLCEAGFCVDNLRMASDKECEAEADTLPLAIALFAQKLHEAKT